jgi:hypothetical protein
MKLKTLALPVFLTALALASCGKGPSTPSTPGLLSGTVVDSTNSAPLAGAKVVVGTTDSALTGADGKFSFNLLQGRYVVQVSRDGYYGVAANVPVLSRDTTRITVYTLLRPWTPGTPMTNPNDYRHNFASVFWGGLYYLVGGRQAQSSLVLGSSLTYSPSTAAWPANSIQQLTPGCELSACLVIRDTLFLFGGLSGSTSLATVLKLSGTSWTSAANPMPAAAHAMSAAAFGDSVFLFGGYVSGAVSDMVRIYRPSADTAGGSPWGTTVSLPSPRAGMSCAAVGGQAYLFGGLDNAGAARSSAFRFNPASGAWTTMTDMPAARAYAACASIGNRIFLFGGVEAGTARAGSLRYDIAGNSWTAVSDLPLARYGAAAAAYNDRIHVLGGFDGTNSLGLVEIYNPAADVK